MSKLSLWVNTILKHIDATVIYPSSMVLVVYIDANVIKNTHTITLLYPSGLQYSDMLIIDSRMIFKYKNE